MILRRQCSHSCLHSAVVCPSKYCAWHTCWNDKKGYSQREVNKVSLIRHKLNMCLWPHWNISKALRWLWETAVIAVSIPLDALSNDWFNNDTRTPQPHSVIMLAHESARQSYVIWHSEPSYSLSERKFETQVTYPLILTARNIIFSHCYKPSTRMTMFGKALYSDHHRCDLIKQILQCALSQGFGYKTHLFTMHQALEFGNVRASLPNLNAILGNIEHDLHSGI